MSFFCCQWRRRHESGASYRQRCRHRSINVMREYYELFVHLLPFTNWQLSSNNNYINRDKWFLCLCSTMFVASNGSSVRLLSCSLRSDLPLSENRFKWNSFVALMLCHLPSRNDHFSTSKIKIKLNILLRRFALSGISFFGCRRATETDWCFYE